jgi:hypothetical protein
MDGERLEADVMRFMAIIAFCLIAILALVRNVEPTTIEQLPPSTSEPTNEAAGEPVAGTDLAEDEPPTPEAPPEPVQVTNSSSMFVPIDPTPAPDTLVQPPPAFSQPRPPEPIAASAHGGENTPASPQSPAAEPVQEELVLRFVSDGDFLRLIAKGEVQVFAFHDRQVLALGEDYLFHESAAPGKVHEVLSETIPRLIDTALKKRTPEASQFKWAIHLPQQIERQIQRYLNTVTNGQLLIDRYGKVNHVATR